MPSYKLQVQDDDARPEYWRDVTGADGAPLVFGNEQEARTRLEADFPVLVKLEKFAAGPKRTRVIVAAPYADVDREKDE